MGWVLLWASLGFLGWSWINYSAFRHDGALADKDPMKRHLLFASPFLGPFMIVLNTCISLYVDKFYWGLRFR